MFETLQVILIILLVGLFNILLYIRSTYFLQMVQQLGYIPAEYKEWIASNRDKAYSFSKDKTKMSDSKKPLVYTDRAKRLLITNTIINAVILLALLSISFFVKLDSMAYVLYVSLIIFVAILLYFYQSRIMMLALYIINPHEKRVNNKFYKMAQDKIKDQKINGLTVIAITGSYGKTSTKTILAQILSNYKRVYSSPSSFNTPMGLSKIINNELNESHQIFIAEMGARYTGEIKELVDLVFPDIGIITNIGPCHLETFGSIENIIKTKFELADGLKNKAIIVNADSELVLDEANRRNLDCYKVGIDNGDLTATIKTINENGTVFDINFVDGPMEAHTKLLGRHNILNIIMATQAAIEVGMQKEDIIRAIANLEQVEHRLNIIKNPGGAIVIDDAFNSNPDGARAALEVLNLFEGGKKIIVTPGMVELGDLQETENFKLGEEIAKMTDISILVGKKIADDVNRGVEATDNIDHKNYRVDTLDDATKLLGEILSPGDVVLFENDLTDIY
ncbi:UDP-N-acetylmuramoyl-tripeptide--D-alanyl-D-alanine ligase [Ezakiella peruensis]|uniref:UDP-N-acetylmuramoyl-tripeptide--D-alanyl-D- alanine ligase n=1 Tax=Ezakiella peruensis TaxID=1464038 RepID=UPI000C1B2F92|nr:UDP-N-acetylmuramoyl-tripeptide--D-alanyl-D-alanine ligase [Ezakiella peruensis]